MLRAVHRLELLKELVTSPFLNSALLFFMSESHLMFENTSFHQKTLNYKDIIIKSTTRITQMPSSSVLGHPI